MDFINSHSYDMDDSMDFIELLSNALLSTHHKSRTIPIFFFKEKRSTLKKTLQARPKVTSIKGIANIK